MFFRGERRVDGFQGVAEVHLVRRMSCLTCLVAAVNAAMGYRGRERGVCRAGGYSGGSHGPRGDAWASSMGRRIEGLAGAIGLVPSITARSGDTYIRPVSPAMLFASLAARFCDALFRNTAEICPLASCPPWSLLQGDQGEIPTAVRPSLSTAGSW